ncbi:hypothetical protein OIV83_004811 [Microbotryomycetes sp. JL201]|nr:hypothetical protein OIV83_004811 [Microbotryomycetes sp. JL201]
MTSSSEPQHAILEPRHVVSELTHPRVPSLKAQVVVDGKLAAVYDTKYEGGNKVTGYIEAIEGKDFTVQFQCRDSELAPYYKALKVNVAADHHNLASWAFKPKRSSTAVDTCSVGSVRDSAITVRPLRFGTVSVTDTEQDGVDNANVYESAGKLTIEVRRLSSLNFVKVKAGSKTAYDEGFKKQPLHEKFKPSLLSHQTELGPPKFSNAPKRSGYRNKVDYIDSKDGPPYVLFEFRYLSRFLLELGDHIPPHLLRDSDAPAPANTPTVDLTASEHEYLDEETQSELLRVKKRYAEIKGLEASKKAKVSSERKPFATVLEQDDADSKY